jgi:hypothetical protein
MQDDYSSQVFGEKSSQKTQSAAAAIEMKLREVMTQGEMEILTTWFPKAARALARVLRNRLH